VLLLKSDVLDARVRERPASLPSPATGHFLLEPEDDVLEGCSVLDFKGSSRQLVVMEGGLWDVLHGTTNQIAHEGPAREDSLMSGYIVEYRYR